MIRILHVHDDPEHLRYVKHILEAMEKRLKIESNVSPDEIPSMLLSETYNAILMNYRMLEKNGFEFEERVRRIKDIPLIMYQGTG